MKQSILILLTAIPVICGCSPQNSSLSTAAQTPSQGRAITRNMPNIATKAFTADDIRWNDKIEDPTLGDYEFTQLMAEAMRSVAQPNTRINVVEPLVVTITYPDGIELQSYLKNAWRHAKQSPGSRKEKLAVYVLVGKDQISQGKLDRATIMKSVVPTIRSEAHANDLAKRSNGKQHSYFEPFVGDIVLEYGVDLPKSIHCLTTDDFAALKVSKDELKKLAHANFKRLRPDLQLVKNPNFEIYSIDLGGDYESTILVFDKFWQEDAKKFCPTGNIVACVPARADVHFASDSDPKAIHELRQIAQRIYDSGDHVVSTQLIKRTKNGWEAYR